MKGLPAVLVGLPLLLLTAGFPFVSFASVTCSAQLSSNDNTNIYGGNLPSGHMFGVVFTPGTNCTVTSFWFDTNGGSSDGGDLTGLLYEWNGGSPMLLETCSTITNSGTIPSGHITYTCAGTTNLLTTTEYLAVTSYASHPTGAGLQIKDQAAAPSGFAYAREESGSWISGPEWAVKFEVDGDAYTPPETPTSATSSAAEVQATTLLIFFNFLVFVIGLVLAIWIYRVLL